MRIPFQIGQGVCVCVGGGGVFGEAEEILKIIKETFHILLVDNSWNW